MTHEVVTFTDEKPIKRGVAKLTGYKVGDYLIGWYIYSVLSVEPAVRYGKSMERLRVARFSRKGIKVDEKEIFSSELI